MPRYDGFPTRLEGEHGQTVALLQHCHPAIYAWREYFESVERFVNGYWFNTPQGSWLINPPALDEVLLEAFEGLTSLEGVILTSPRCEPVAWGYSQAFDIPVLVPEGMQASLQTKAHARFRSGETLFNTFKVHAFEEPHLKGDCLLHWEEEGLLVIGDTLFADAQGGLHFLAPDAQKPALQTEWNSLLATLSPIDTLLCCQGDALLGDASLPRTL